jgi:hypothetical protein
MTLVLDRMVAPIWEFGLPALGVTLFIGHNWFSLLRLSLGARGILAERRFMASVKGFDFRGGVVYK